MPRPSAQIVMCFITELTGQHSCNLTKIKINQSIQKMNQLASLDSNTTYGELKVICLSLAQFTSYQVEVARNAMRRSKNYGAPFGKKLFN